MKMPSTMNHSFSQVPRAEIPRSQFNRSSGFKTTFDSGYLVPMFIDEALPGDTFNLSSSLFARLATPIVPVMDNLYLDTFYFFVPNRLIWDNWQKFNGEQNNPGDSTDFLVPQMNSGVTGYALGSLSDYFGLPLTVQGYDHSSLWHRAYNLIWNEWFRDQNLQDSVVVDKDDGPDDKDDYVLLRRGKRHDYFTSALPWPQKGPSVELPLGSTAPVIGIGTNTQVWTTGPSVGKYETGASASRTYAKYKNINPAAGDTSWSVEEDPNNIGFPGIFADLSSATAATVNALREAFQIQKLFERDARGGTRYTEIIKSHFGVTSPDARLQRPEYLGGGSTQINFHPVSQTSESATTPQGNLAAFATASASGHGFTKSFTEHGVIIGLCSVRADLNYQQGLNRMFSRRTREEFYWPALSHLGEQAILHKEIYTNGPLPPPGFPEDDAVFGYQERYAEYRYKPSIITGQFRSEAPASLDVWHLAQDFDGDVVLNEEFIQDNPPIDRIIATPTEPQFLLDAYHALKCTRPMPTYSVPGLIDHF